MNKNYKKYLKFIQEQKQKHYFNSKKRRNSYFVLESKYIISILKKDVLPTLYLKANPSKPEANP
tara:strand:+ start:1066 stop:1257 length:192 start_codon:yes stop_codon:yes gene_type:complete